MIYETPEVYDELIAVSSSGRINFPGICEIEVDSGINEDSEDLAGGDGTVTKLSYAPAQVTIKNRVWTQAQYDAQTRLISIFRTPKGSKPIEMEVLHPKLERYNITRLYCFSVKEPANLGQRENEVTFILKESWPEVRSNKVAKIGDGGPVNVENIAISPLPVSEQYDFNKLAPEIPEKN